MTAREITGALTSASFRYALRRVAIFPLAPGSKCPIKNSHGLRDATNDSDATRSRWQRTPQANIGAATGLADVAVVISVALQHGVSGEALARSIGRLPASPVAPADLDHAPGQKVPASPIGAALDLVSSFERKSAK